MSELREILKNRTWGAVYLAGPATLSVCSESPNLLPYGSLVLCILFPYCSKTKYKKSRLAYVEPFAWGFDYHKEVRHSLETLNDRFRQAGGVLEELATLEKEYCVDITHYDDRFMAVLTGVGKIGRNRLIMAPWGTRHFIGYTVYKNPNQKIVDSLVANGDIKIMEGELKETNLNYDDYDRLPPAYQFEGCRTCHLCAKACPTHSLETSYQRCISYLTQANAIPEELEHSLGNRLYGCSICQDVCPINRQKVDEQMIYINGETNEETLAEKADREPGEPQNFIDPKKILSMSGREFKRQYGWMSFAWRVPRIYRRNAYIVLGNTGDEEDLEWLENTMPQPSSDEEKKMQEKTIKKMRRRLGICYNDK